MKKADKVVPKQKVQDARLPWYTTQEQEDSTCHPFYPRSAMLKDKRGRTMLKIVETQDDINQRKIEKSVESVEKLKERDHRGNIAHMRAILNTIRVIGQGHAGQSTKLLH